MFDDDDLFDLTDDPFEWDLLLDDDELEQGRRKRQGKKTDRVGNVGVSAPTADR